MSHGNPRANSGIQPGSMKTITDNKLVAFVVGQQKKSRFQKAREEKEMKKKLEEEAAAKVYESFVASFEDDESSKTFVRGGIVNEKSGSMVERAGEVYKMEQKSVSGKKEMDLLLEEMKASLSTKNNLESCSCFCF
jgi:U2-associated protein SR140